MNHDRQPVAARRAPEAETSRPARILVVDDQDETRRVVGKVLTTLGYEPELARDGVEALAKLPLDIDLVLLDAEMPNLDGFAVARQIREDPEYMHLPIIMVTGLGGKADRLRAVEAGINDFVTKPFDIDEIRLRVAWLLKLKQASDALKRQRAELEQIVERRTGALREALDEMADAQRRTYDAHLDTIRRLVIAAEYKHHDTAAHIERIGRYSEILARGLSLAPGLVEVMRHATPMHDVGKIGIPDAILLKPGALDADEWEIMKQHTVIGGRILHGSPSEVLQAGERIALSHHERWDGSGYPGGLRGEEIPLGGRICAAADVFDAMTSNRHYRDALPNEAVYELMRTQRDRHFDPAVVDVFFDHLAEIEAIQRGVRER